MVFLVWSVGSSRLKGVISLYASSEGGSTNLYLLQILHKPLFQSHLGALTSIAELFIFKQLDWDIYNYIGIVIGLPSILQDNAVSNS